jgi:LEA14-like dessication related protein
MKHFYLIGPGMVAIVSSLFLGCSRPQLPQYQAVEHFRINNIGLNNAAVSAELKYFNPNNFQLRLRHVALDIYLNDRFAGRSLLDTLMIIPAKDSFFIPLSCSVEMKGILSNAINLLLTNEIGLKLSGSVRLQKAGIVFTIPVQYEGKERIDL